MTATGPGRELPPLKLRDHRRLVPELGLPSLRREPALPPASGPAPLPARPRRRPLYWRVLRLRHVHPNGWQRALLVEGAALAGVVVVLAGFATAWTVLVLPVVVAVVVKGHDVLAGSLEPPRRRSD